MSALASPSAAPDFETPFVEKAPNSFALRVEQLSRKREPRQAPAVPGTANDASLSQVGTFSSFHARRRFCGEGDPAEYVYRLTDGLVEGYHITSGGRRQIVDFYAPGDIFGVEAGPDYTLFVDAVTDGRVQVIKRSAVFALISSNSAASSELWSCLAASVHRNQAHIIRLGRPATEKIAAFILDMCDRLSGHDECHFPMTRQEIGDHLDLTVETVSRTLTLLRQSGLIALGGSRDIVILDRQRLCKLLS